MGDDTEVTLLCILRQLLSILLIAKTGVTDKQMHSLCKSSCQSTQYFCILS